MEETISLKEIFEVIKKRFLLIVGLVCGAAIIAALISYFVLTPTYQSSSQFLVNQGQQDPAQQFNVNDIRTNVELINTYNVILRSPVILDEVVDELELPYGTSVLKNKIQVSNEQNSQVVAVTVTDPSPEMATTIANATVEIFQKKVPEVMNGVDNVHILSAAVTSPNPSQVSPKPLLNIAIAIVLGAMVGIGIAFILEYMDNSVRTEEDIEKKLGLPVLGVISHISNEDIRSEQFRFQKNRVTRGAYDVSPQKKSI